MDEKIFKNKGLMTKGRLQKKNGIFNELGIKGGRGVILKHHFINWCNDETWG